jgi:trans-2,3-dihydro-3-hydroxyanthranilate isomerase
VDVFASAPLAGNQLAVFAAPADLPDLLMQQVTRELNHSETVFLQPPTRPDADWRVRIYIPTLPLANEIPFAGHPLLGTGCVAVGPAGGLVRLETGAGVVPVTVTPLGEGRWEAWMEQPRPRLVRVIDDREALALALGLTPDALRSDVPVEAVDNGMQTVIIPLASVAAVQQAVPDMARLRELLGRDGLCTLVFATGGIAPDADVHCRVFSPFDLVAEDPATGSANGPLGEYLVRHGVLPGPLIVSEQGFAVGRPSRLQIRIAEGVQVGGEVRLIGEGVFRIQVAEGSSKP